ncbi:hypothetical protein [Hungatella hathewayi]|uniref:hypothetical protein n=1 Tax=Hungatella hathewayi TaxID=154046 RepID=UPI003568639E
MKNIEDELNNLILKYEIDELFPRFRICVQAGEWIRKWHMSFPKKARLLIIGNMQTDIDYFIDYFGSDDLVLDTELVKEGDVGRKKDQWLDYDDIIYVSYSGAEGSEGEMLYLYDLLFKNGLQCLGNYYDIFGRQYYEFRSGIATSDYKFHDICSIFFYDRIQFEKAVNRGSRQEFLKKIIFECVYARDFLTLKEYLHTYIIEKYDDWVRYEKFAVEIKRMLEKIKSELNGRESKDVLLFWLDALEYGEDKDMPFLNALDQETLVFQNAYTVTPFTNPTARVLFTKSRTVEEQAYKILTIDENNSPLIKELKKHGYQFQYYGSLKAFRDRRNPAVSVYTVMTQIYWRALVNVLMSDYPVFCIMHEVIETHDPYISMGIRGDCYAFQESMPEVDEEFREIKSRQMIESRAYVDQQVRFYSQMFQNNNSVKIFMSDHGHTEYGRYHTVCKVLHKEIGRYQEKRIFSYYNFDKLCSYLLGWNNVSLDDVVSEFGIIQDVDYYHGPLIQQMMRKDRFSENILLGYQGVVTDDIIYRRLNNGQEYFYNPVGKKQRISSRELDRARELCLQTTIDIEKDEKFEYSRYVYWVIERYQKRNGYRDVLKKKAIRELFDRCGQDAKIALRGGGMHTLYLYWALEWNQRGRIVFIIDNNKECTAKMLGLPVIPLESSEQSRVDYVMISSFRYDAEWTEEMKQYYKEDTVISIYAWLAGHGLNCKEEFYRKEYEDSDFFVGFPSEVRNDKVR